LEGDRHRLPELFMVVATQNPIEYEGTYPLPEAQLDRFFFKLLVDHPDAEVEQAILARYHHGFDARQLDALQLVPVIDQPVLVSLRAGWQAVAVEPGVMTYITNIVRATRASADVLLGASPRAGIALLLGSKVLAALSGREYVLPDDVKRLALPVLRHRILLKPEAELEALTPDQVIQRLLAGVEVPR
jgi:MoxR-like ATPase